MKIDTVVVTVTSVEAEATKVTEATGSKGKFALSFSILLSKYLMKINMNKN